MKQTRYDIVALVDKEGELIETEGAKVVVRDSEDDRKAVRGGLFCKVWLGGIERLEKSEIVFLVRIMEYLWYEDNTIRLDGEAMSVKEMAKATGIGYARLSESVRELIGKRVMGEHSVGIMKGYRGRRKRVYSVNPFVMCKGVMISKEVVDFYEGR